MSKRANDDRTSMMSLKLLVSRLVGDEATYTVQQRAEIDLYREDTAASLQESIINHFNLPDGCRLMLFFEKMKQDPDDPASFFQRDRRRQ